MTHALIAVVVILAFVLNLLVLQDRSSTALVAVADQPIAGGTVLDLDTIRLVPVDADFAGLDALVGENSLASLEGWVLGGPIAEGTPLRKVDLVEPGPSSGLRSMSLPVPVEHAAGGSIGPGDIVDVIAVADGSASFVATGLEVISVADRSTGSIGATGSYHIVVAVEAEQALRLAAALESGSIELLRSTGAGQIEDAG